MSDKFISTVVWRCRRRNKNAKKITLDCFAVLLKNEIKAAEIEAHICVAKKVVTTIYLLRKTDLELAKQFTKELTGWLWGCFNRFDRSHRSERRIDNFIGNLWQEMIAADDAELFEVLLAAPQLPMTIYGLVGQIITSGAVECAKVLVRKSKVIVEIDDFHTGIETIADATLKSIKSAQAMETILFKIKNDPYRIMRMRMKTLEKHPMFYHMLLGMLEQPQAFGDYLAFAEQQGKSILDAVRLYNGVKGFYSTPELALEASYHLSTSFKAPLPIKVMRL